jgi:alpha-galactosidase
MGWNSWNSYASSVSAELVMKVADILVESGLRDAGYTYVNIDDGWALRARTLSEGAELGTDPVDDPNSLIEANPLTFPASEDGTPGIKVVADYVHEKGLKLGLYSDRGTATCGSFAASGGHEKLDAQTFAEWGVDYLKYDSCFASNEASVREAEYRAMSDALKSVEPVWPIVFSLCTWQFDEWNAEAGQLWRTTGDIAKSFNDTAAVTAPSRTIMQNASSNAAYAAYAGPNQWNDPDMLEVGNLGTSTLANTESQSHFNLWAMMAAPLIAGNRLASMTDETLAILGNRAVIAIDQDPLGLQGVAVKSTESTSVWAKPLARAGERAVLLLNTGERPQEISAGLSEVGLRAGEAMVRDLWNSSDSGHTIAEVISATVAAHGSVMLEVVGEEPLLPKGTAYLSDLGWTYAANALGPVERDASNGGRATGDGKPLSLRGKAYSKGLGVAAGSKVIYRLANHCSRFNATVGVDDETQGAGSVKFEVWADGEKLFPSGDAEIATGDSAPRTIDVDLTGKYRLTLLTTSAGDGSAGDRADWADARITCAE